MEINKDTYKKIRNLILFTILVIFAIFKLDIILNALGYLNNIIFPFVLGIIIAFILNVPMSFFEKKLFQKRKNKNKYIYKIQRPLALLLTIALFIGVIIIMIFVIVPQVGDTLVRLGVSIQEFIPEVKNWGENLFKDNDDVVNWINSIQFDWDSILAKVGNLLTYSASSVLDVSFSAAKNLVSGIVNFFIAFVFACYILFQKEKLRSQLIRVLLAFLKTSKVNKVLEISSLVYKTFASFLTGQFIEAIILGTMFFVSMSIMGLPYPLLVGLLIGFTALIPIVGAFIGCFLGAFFILVESPTQALIFVILFLILQQIEGNIIYPHVVGNSVGLPSIWVLVAVTLGGSLMGVFGMLIFIPIASVLYTLFREIVDENLKNKNIRLKPIEEDKSKSNK